jgi:anti-sigma factor RsiW/streptogramin lyase
MGMVHLSFEELSALFDGELSAQADSAARQHLRACPECSAEYSLNVRLERDLRQPPVLSCDTVLELLSATFDDQASPPDRAVAERHLGACAACRGEVQAWGNVGYLLRTLPAGRPSARVDQSIARLANPPRRGLPAFPRLAPRLAIAGAAILAVIIGGLPLAQTPAPTPARQPENERVIVAAAQQIVYNEKNNTFYQLDTAAAVVNALEPITYDVKARIPVGGEPIGLTLNEPANTILVLDAVQKKFTEIDAVSNTVIGSTPVVANGTPTIINVGTSGEINVYSVSTPTAGTAPVSTVSVLDSTTKQLQTVREIDVAPRMVVVDPLSNQAVLVSREITKLVDSSYKVIGTLPGGVAAAFSRKGDGLAILSPTGADTTINFAGSYAPTALKLQGSPLAITALKQGGYLVSLQIEGQGRVVKISPDGRAEGSTGVGVAGGDLLYDEATSFFTVASAAGKVESGQVLVDVSAASATPSSAPPSSASPSASAASLASPTVANSPAPTSLPAPSAEPTKSPSPTPVVVAVPAADVLDNARSIAPDLYTASLPSGIKPYLMTATGTRVWFVDLASRVGTFDMNTGETKIIAKLRADARVGYWVAGRSFVFGVDPASGQVHVVNTVTDSVDSFATNVLSPVSAVAVGHDDRLWLALRDASYLLAWDPKTRGMDSFDLGDSRVSALAVDRLGRVVYSDDVHSRIGTLDPTTSNLVDMTFSRHGNTTALIVDGSGTLWLGTSTGDLYSVKSDQRGLAFNVRRAVSTLALDRSGRAWYLAPIPNGIPGFGYAPVDGSEPVRSIPGPATGLAFSESGRAFSADPRGAFYVAAEAGR